MKTTCHFEFWGAIRTREQLDTFFSYTDPEYVHFFCDTAQHTIAGVDPLQLFRDYNDRCTGFHFKDTQNVDEHEAYRTPPDPELMAPQVTALVLRDGHEGGLVDFPALMKEIVALGLRRLADRRARQGRARWRQLRRGHRRRQVVHRQRPRPGRGRGPRPSWRPIR